MSEKIEVKNGWGDLSFFLPLFLWLFFFSRGCSSEPRSSYFDEYMKGAHGHVVEGVKYEETVD